jgi:ssDNA-binding Zn-finger/Zn-ribbon topoisomerase 1
MSSSEQAVEIRCGKCSRPMAERENRANGSTFLGCTGYPDFCSETAKLPEYLRLKRAGASELPGFGEDL